MGQNLRFGLHAKGYVCQKNKLAHRPEHIIPAGKQGVKGIMPCSLGKGLRVDRRTDGAKNRAKLKENYLEAEKGLRLE